MLLHSVISQSPPHPQTISLQSSSSSLSNFINFPSGFRNSPLKRGQFKPIIIRNSSSSSSFSQGYSYGTVDYEKKSRTPVTWKAIYKRISMMGNREKGSTSVLNQWENEGRTVTKWELCRLVKELRKYGRFKLALEVYEWMKNKPERFIMAPSDAAIQLDLVSKVEGISGAEDYFKNLPDDLIDNRVYGALLNAYVHARMKEKAESLLVEMKEKEYASHALPYNVMMTLYMNLKDHEKVEAFISEMMQNNIDLDLYSYSIWITSRGSQGSVEKVEEVFEKMKLDVSVKPNWTTYSTLATVYIKLGELEKGEDCLKKIESKITGRYRIPYHYLLSHYGSIGRKEEVQRIWGTYKTVFPYIPNMGYHAVISAFIRMDEIEESEMLYEEWLSVKTTYDARIGNRLLGWYVRKGHSEKTESFFKEMLENGKANSSTWEILAESHIKHKRIPDALSCFEKALSHEESSFWKPKPVNIISFYKICEQENDEPSKEAFFGMLKEAGVLEDESLMSKLPFLRDSNAGNELPKVKESEDYDDEDADTLLNELQVGV
ncbi:pentatricopeptide repeat-containing protein At1g02150-like [Cynara cardunculus var. scolymus]|uniref:pentatricopeptide repeat-containing protein At1g02150-like n=1 Tax=Cynara cardunculus var. scolymus TaxID=59895 RepID=UPI000D627E18|nr:pentatricopeptide repeat-containing protein At1g02150-like [Cynara cardunculus var. scolymus]